MNDLIENKPTFLKLIWRVFIAVLTFIGKHMRALIFIIVLLWLFLPSTNQNIAQPNLMRIDIVGTIGDVSKILKEIKEANKPEIKAVLLYVDSPGGSVAPSVELYMAIEELAKKKPVVAYVAGTMASGSYYAAAHSTQIIANPGAVIGSIGVILQSPNIEELAKKIGISEQSISAGKHKQAGTIMRAWTDEERESLQGLVDDMYNMFTSDIARARDLDIDKIKDFADAKIFIASRAKDVGLIDNVGSLELTISLVEQMSGAENPIWKEPDMIDKFMKVVGVSINNGVSSFFHSLKIY